MPKQGQDTNLLDPNDPYAKVRQNVVNQAGSDPTVAPPPSTPSTPSPTFTTQPVAGTTPQAQPTTPTAPITTQPVPGGVQSGPTTTPSYVNQPATTVPGAPPPATGPGIPAGTVAGPGGSSASTLPHGTLSAPVDGNWQQWFANLVQGQPSSYAAIKQLEPQLANAGVKVNYNAAGEPSKLILPNGHYISVVDQNGAWRWMDQGTAADNAAAQASTANQTPLGITSTSTSSPYDQQVRQMLMDRLGALGQPLDVNDPTITQPFDAARLASARQLEQGKKDTAERLYASGDLNTNAAQVADTQSNERAATGLAGVKANLIANQLQQRANQLQQLYSLAVASGDSESARQVQLELASIQAELAREGYGVNLASIQANQNVTATKPFLTA